VEALRKLMRRSLLQQGKPTTMFTCMTQQPLMMFLCDDDDVSLVVSDDGRLITFKSQHVLVFTMECVDETEAGNIRTAVQNE
jgi:hypothetical protein